MMFFDCIPKKWAYALNDSRWAPLRRTSHYRLINVGLKYYKDEVDIVKVLRDLRMYKAGFEKLIISLPKQI